MIHVAHGPCHARLSVPPPVVSYLVGRVRLDHWWLPVAGSSAWAASKLRRRARLVNDEEQRLVELMRVPDTDFELEDLGDSWEDTSSLIKKRR